MSTGLIILVAVATAAAVILVSWVLVNLFHVAVDNLAERAPDISRLRELTRQYSARQYSVGARRGAEPVGEQATPSPRSEPSQEPPLAAAEAVDEGDRRANAEGASYRQVGEEVTAVLTAAERAAAQIRETTLQEAEQTRRAADEQAAATLAEAEARRAEADRYAEETRAAADEEAAATLSEAEEQARLVRAEAEQEAQEIQAEALRRREALAASTESMQERIESMVRAFHRASGELEELLPAERRSTPQEEEPLDEALHGELRSRADH
jgi:hypothetical protein